MYIGAGLLFFVVAGIMATLMRMQLFFPSSKFLEPDVFNRFFTMHGTAMIFLVAMPWVFGFANYLVPLMIGTRDMAFPRLNAFGFWVFLFSGLFLFASYFTAPGLYNAGSAPDVGWFAYSPLTAKAFSKGTQHGLLDALSAFEWHWKHCHRDQYSGDGLLPALQGHDSWQDAALRLDDACDIVSRCHRDAAVLGLPDHAHSGSIPRTRNFSTRRRAARRCSGSTSSGSSVIRRSTSWCFRPSRSPRKSSRSFRASRSLAIRSWLRRRSRSRSSAWACGRTTCSRSA